MSSTTKDKETIEKNKTRKKARRNNATLYATYKVFAWDLLCYYSIEYLFLTIAKGITPSQVLIMSAIYTISKVLLYIPAVVISEYIGKRRSIILGNSLVLMYMILLMISPNIFVIGIAQVISAFGYDFKGICDSNLLYDSVATKGGDGLYTKIESRGGSGYYIADAALSIIAGYLFVINNYIPMIICTICVAIGLFISCKFKDIYYTKNKKKISKFVEEYKTDIVSAFKFVKVSKRIKAYILFGSVFYGFIKIFDTYKSNLLTTSGVEPQLFSIIIAILSLIAAISVKYAQKIQDKFKNKTLSVISFTYLLSWLIIGIISIKVTNSVAIPIILMLYVVNRVCDSQWYIARGKYLRNFTSRKSRNKIIFVYELITSMAVAGISLIGAKILEITDVKKAIVLVALASLALMIVVLDYMKNRFGLKPKEYRKEDIKIIS